MTAEQAHLIKKIFKYKNKIEQLASYWDLLSIDSYVLDDLITLEDSYMSEYDEYAEYTTGGHHSDGLTILEAAKNKIMDTSYLESSLLCFNPDNQDSIFDINAIRTILDYSEFKINKLISNTKLDFTGFKYQARFISGEFCFKNNWLIFEALNCSSDEFQTAFKYYVNSFDIEYKHRCFLDFYYFEIENENTFLLKLDFADIDFLSGNIISIPQDCIFKSKLKKLVNIQK